jgi:hypothetical protein
MLQQSQVVSLQTPLAQSGANDESPILRLQIDVHELTSTVDGVTWSASKRDSTGYKYDIFSCTTTQ